MIQFSVEKSISLPHINLEWFNDFCLAKKGIETPKKRANLQNGWNPLNSFSKFLSSTITAAASKILLLKTHDFTYL